MGKEKKIGRQAEEEEEDEGGDAKVTHTHKKGPIRVSDAFRIQNKIQHSGHKSAESTAAVIQRHIKRKMKQRETCT